MSDLRIEKLSMESTDITQENINKIKELFPQVVTEGKIDFDVLKTILGEQIEERTEKYQFTWNGKSDTIRFAQKPSTGTLRPDKESSKNWDTTENLYIEGDNLEVLKLLQKTYHNKIKMIYIDPPYNTGGDFVYKDDFKDSIKNYKEQTNQTLRTNPETNGRYHTDWLNMMYSRLMLAKNLLTDDGVIFISIDENELINLSSICNQVYGEENYVSLLSIENNPKGRKNSKFISVSNDYILVYAKNIKISYFIENIPKNINDLKEDENGNFVHNSGKRILVGENKFNKFVENYNSNKHYSVYYNKNDKKLIINKEENLEDSKIDLLSKGYERYISYFDGKFVENTYSLEKLDELFRKNALEFKNNKIYEKNMNTSIRIKSIITNRNYTAYVNSKIVDYAIDIKTTSAGTQLKELFGTDDLIFSNPKSIGLINLLLTLIESKNFYVLDFFSGSSTTAHAVMQLNAEDGGNRKFIMVQLPEKTDEKSEAFKTGFNNICEIGKERIRRAGEKIKSELIEKNKKAGMLDDSIDPEKLDVGFKVYKLDSSNFNVFDSSSKDINNIFNHDVFLSDRSKLDILFEILLKYGVFDKPVEVLNINNKEAYSVAFGHMLVFINQEITEQDINEVVALKPREVIIDERGFRTDNDKMNAVIRLEAAGVEKISTI